MLVSSQVREGHAKLPASNSPSLSQTLECPAQKSHAAPSLFARKVLDSPQFEVVWESLRVGSGWKVGWLFSTVAGRWVCPLLQPAPASIHPAAARPGACHSVPQHATLCHRMPLCATACHYVLKNATLCHRMPPYAIECH